MQATPKSIIPTAALSHWFPRQAEKTPASGSSPAGWVSQERIAATALRAAAAMTYSRRDVIPWAERSGDTP